MAVIKFQISLFMCYNFGCIALVAQFWLHCTVTMVPAVFFTSFLRETNQNLSNIDFLRNTLYSINTAYDIWSTVVF